MFESLRSLVRVFHTPVSADTQQHLQAAGVRLPEYLRTPYQFLGRQYAGCGATIGAMPRCDFACRGCYLGKDANHIPAQSVDEITRQLRQIRAWLGEGGNVQLTDGEVTLRPATEVVALIRYARAIGLVPMLMTHGDTFRRNPGLLKRLVQEGGLSELSIHIDTTQRGRRGQAYKHATGEEDLLPLRDEFAEMIRRVRQETGQTLDVATTFTVTRDNQKGVPSVIRWLCQNADAFKMISFQPVAQVGRTKDGLGGSVSVDELWALIAEGLSGERADAKGLLQHTGGLGHPACNRFVQGLVVHQTGEQPVFHPLFSHQDPHDMEVLQGWLDRYGGLTFRLDTKWQAVARLCGLVKADARFLVFKIMPFLLRWPRRFEPEHPLRFVWRWLRGRARVHYLNLVSHHFMSKAEMATPLGQERLNLCIFQVPIGDKLVSMCEVNALGVRDRYYETIRTGRIPTASVTVQAA